MPRRSHSEDGWFCSTIMAMSFISTVYGIDTTGRVAVWMTQGWSSSTQSATYSIPASASQSMVS